MRNTVINTTSYKKMCARVTFILILSLLLFSCSRTDSQSSRANETSISSAADPACDTISTLPPPISLLPVSSWSADQHLEMLLGAGCLNQSWGSPAELSPDGIVNFYTALSQHDPGVDNMLPNLPQHPSGGGVMYASYVEEVAYSYFGVPSEYVRTSPLYYAPGNGYLLYGLGSVAQCPAREVIIGDTQISIRFNKFWDGEPFGTGTLTLQVQPDNSVRYQSYILDRTTLPPQEEKASLDDLYNQYVAPIAHEDYLHETWNNSKLALANERITNAPSLQPERLCVQVLNSTQTGNRLNLDLAVWQSIGTDYAMRTGLLCVETSGEDFRYISYTVQTAD